MQPFRPGTRPSCSWWPRPPQTPGPKSKLSHPSAQPGRVARFAAQTAAGAPCPHLPSRLDAVALPSVPELDLRASVPPARDHPEAGGCWRAVSRLFLSHAVEHRSRRRKILAQSFGKVCIHALVFFFQRNGQSENLAFRQLVEVLHGAIRLPMRRLGSKTRRLNRRGRRERPPRRRSFMDRKYESAVEEDLKVSVYGD